MQLESHRRVNQLTSILMLLAAGSLALTHPAPATSAIRIARWNVPVDKNADERRHLAYVLDKISASPDQRTKIKQVVGSYGAGLTSLRLQLATARADFITNITEGKSPEAVMAKEAQLGKFTSSVEMQTSLMHLEIRKLLQPDQWQAFERYWQLKTASAPDN